MIESRLTLVRQQLFRLLPILWPNYLNSKVQLPLFSDDSINFIFFSSYCLPILYQILSLYFLWQSQLHSCSFICSQSWLWAAPWPNLFLWGYWCLLNLFLYLKNHWIAYSLSFFCPKCCFLRLKYWDLLLSYKYYGALLIVHWLSCLTIIHSSDLIFNGLLQWSSNHRGRCRYRRNLHKKPEGSI